MRRVNMAEAARVDGYEAPQIEERVRIEAPLVLLGVASNSIDVT